ncbi:hypothetical protein [Roseivirga pacifica]
MKKLGWLLSCMIMVLALNVSAQEGGADDFLDILEQARKSDKKTKLANLDSYGKQNDTASVRPIREADVMFKVRLWSRMNFNEKINRSFNSKDSKLAQLIFEGIEEYYKGDTDIPSIKPYTAEVLSIDTYDPSTYTAEDSVLTEQQFSIVTEDYTQNKSAITDAEVQSRADELRIDPQYANLDTDLKRQEEARRQLQAERAVTNNFDKNTEITEIIFEEDLIFDKNHSVPMWDVVSLIVVGPVAPAGSPNPGIIKNLFRVKYADVKRYVDYVYNTTKKKRAYWYNPGNPGSKEISFSDAIDKRLFNSYVVSVQNVDNENVVTTLAKDENRNYSSLEYSEKIRMQLLERIHNLWEY